MMSANDFAEISRLGKITRLDKGEVLFQEGDPGNEMYVVVDGCVEISIKQGNKQIVLARLERGDFFGDMSLLESLPRSGTATAVIPTTLAALDQDNFRRLLAIDTELAWRVMKGLSARIRSQNRELAARLGNDLNDMANQLNDSAQEIARAIKGIASSAEEIDVNEKNLADNIKHVQLISGKIVDSLDFIREVADQTNMLGLNAAIEAARAGEHGRGFNIVAERIRKLSEQSKRNAEDIKKLTSEISTKMKAVIKASEDNVNKSLVQTSTTREVAATVMKVAEMAEKLSRLASSL